MQDVVQTNMTMISQLVLQNEVEVDFLLAVVVVAVAAVAVLPVSLVFILVRYVIDHLPVIVSNIMKKHAGKRINNVVCLIQRNNDCKEQKLHHIFEKEKVVKVALNRKNLK